MLRDMVTQGWTEQPLSGFPEQPLVQREQAVDTAP